MPRPKGYRDKSADPDSRRNGKRYVMRPSVSKIIEKQASEAGVSPNDWLESIILSYVASEGD